MKTKKQILFEIAEVKEATKANIETLEKLLENFPSTDIIKIFVDSNDSNIDHIKIPKGLSYQIINKKKGSIGQAHNYPNLVEEV